MMAARVFRLGRKGWLERNFAELKRLEAQNPKYLQVRRYRGRPDTYDIRIKGRGKFRRYKLHLRCTWPTPSIPPKFILVNRREIASANHPHITEIYACLKVPWTPNMSLASIVETIKEVWWNPKEL